jgi:large subunit ribosomal protein L29
MTIPKFSEVTSFSNSEICEEIVKIEKELFNLRFKKATRQSFKSHQIKYTKRRLAHLKTILTLRLDSLEENDN